MINSYNSVSQTVDTNIPLTFDTNKVKSGCAIEHYEGTTVFTLRRPGEYYISFNGDAAASSATIGDIVVELFNNAVSEPGAIATAYSGTTTDTQNLKFSTIIKVLPSCRAIDNTSTITIRNSGIPATFLNANIVITKLC